MQNGNPTITLHGRFARTVASLDKFLSTDSRTVVPDLILQHVIV
jgi:hypothetical protein